jgi:hypothetical protein
MENKKLDELNELLTNNSLPEILVEFLKEYSYYVPERVKPYDIFQQILKKKVSYLNSQNNPNFEILSFYTNKKHEWISTKKGFFGNVKEKKNYTNEKIVISKGTDEFNNIISNNIGDFRIYSVLRKNDNTILTVEDKTTYHNSFDPPDYFEKIGRFCLDGEYYMNWELKSESGIQVAFGGGTFIDIKNIILKN